MNVAVLSGKGGTGKTTVAVNIFNVLKKGVLIDTDTEEPNSHLFLDGTIVNTYDVKKNHPVINMETCSMCGKCGSHCHFNAIIPTKKKILVFEDLCHDCGLCQIVCPNGAISYKEKAQGTITKYQYKNKDVYSGKLNIGEVSGVRIIEDLKRRVAKEELVIIDSPPGVSCSTVASIEGADYAIVVIEPTPFGLSDMKMVVELLREKQIPFGVVINKSGLGNMCVSDYLEEEQIELLTKIPFKKEFAVLYSEGKIISDYSDLFKEKIEEVIAKVQRRVLS